MTPIKVQLTNILHNYIYYSSIINSEAFIHCFNTFYNNIYINYYIVLIERLKWYYKRF
uniref:Uncharacterized protein n=1 Tax=Myoviridae sp. ctkfK18 TaxID=2825165 RepID=A0A8S5VGY4_9CAUD|nr:MAG TPA: hypothetical protein [Myoviridae sp. ctkfK18]